MSIPVYDLPDFGFNQVSFDLIVPKSVNQMQGRRTESRIFGTAYWTAQYQLIPQAPVQAGRADAWIRRIQSQGAVFRAYDASRPRPVMAGLMPLAWAPTVTGISVNGRTIGIAGVGTDFQFTEGDYIAFRKSDLVVSLHSINSDAQANGAGSVSLSIEPPLDTQHFTIASTPIFEKPYCLMQPGDWQAAKPIFGVAPSFSAQEVFFYES